MTIVKRKIKTQPLPLATFALIVGLIPLSLPIAQASFRMVDLNELCPERSVEGEECGMDAGRPVTEGTCQTMGRDLFCLPLEGIEEETTKSEETNKDADTDKKAAPPVEPRFSVTIPTVNLTSVQVSTGRDYRFIDIPWLADYLTGIYKYAVFFASILAAVMLMIGGIQWLTSAGDSSRVGAAQKRITNATVGLVLVLGSYLALSTINPDLVALKPLRIKTVQEEIFHTLGDAPSLSGPGGDYVPLGSATGEVNRDALFSACVSDGSGSINTLRQVLPIWVDLGRRGAAVYVRGGWTGRNGCSFNNSPPTWVPEELRRRNVNFSEHAPQSELENIYRDEVVARIFDAGRMCGDCVSWTQQLFKCAGHPGSSGSRRIIVNDMKFSGSPFLMATGATCREAMTNIPGGIRFGDSFYSDNKGHMFTYTGGEGLGYEIIEMGGLVQSRTTVPNVGGARGFAAVTAHASADAYLTWVDSRGRVDKTGTTGGKKRGSECRAFRYFQ